MEKVFTIVIIDDEPWALVYMKKIFDREDLGFKVLATERTGYDALAVIEKEMPDIVITDIRMPDMSGLDLIKCLRKKDLQCKIIIVSGFAEFSYAQDAIHLGAFEYFLKPIGLDQAELLLGRLLKILIEEKQLNEEKLKLAIPLMNDEESNFNIMLQYIKENYNKRLYLKDLAQQFYLSPNYCCNLFSKVTNMTFSNYVNQLRMEHAIMLLENSSLSINKIAATIGFDDYAYFNKVFKKSFSFTPSQYRKNLTN